jgi:dihydrofolate reductase
MASPPKEDAMRKVIYWMSISIDGFVETLSGDLSWGFPDPELHQHFNDQDRQIDTYLYGRRLYENMAAYWPAVNKDPSAPHLEIEYARLWVEKKKIVFSKTLSQVGWNSQLFKGNIAQEINKLKAQPGKDMIVGGASLASTFMRLGLIDEYRLYIHPVILGSGKPMFPQLSSMLNLELLETRTFGSKVVLLRLASKPSA